MRTTDSLALACRLDFFTDKWLKFGNNADLCVENHIFRVSFEMWWNVSDFFFVQTVIALSMKFVIFYTQPMCWCVHFIVWPFALHFNSAFVRIILSVWSNLNYILRTTKRFFVKKFLIAQCWIFSRSFFNFTFMRIIFSAWSNSDHIFQNKQTNKIFVKKLFFLNRSVLNFSRSLFTDNLAV